MANMSRKWFVAVTLAAALVLSAFEVEVTWGQAAPVIPWTTFSGMAKDVVRTAPSQCGRLAVAMKGNSSYVVFVNEAGTRIAIAYDPAPNDMNARPTHYAVASVDPKQNDRIPVLLWLPLTDETPDPCTLLNAVAGEKA